MNSVTLGVIDPFHPDIVATICDSVPTGWTVTVTDAPTEDARAVALAKADVAFVMATPMPRSLLERAPQLRFIQKLGAGIDRIDKTYCAEAGIGLARLYAGNSILLAEHSVLLMLAACRQLPRLDRGTSSGEWDKEVSRGVNRQIHGKTVGLVGFGAIGRQVARLLSGFGATILYHDPVRASPNHEVAFDVAYRDLDPLLSESDIVSLHMPLLPETRNLLDARRIRSMKRGSIVINAARGELVDELELVLAMRDGHLFSAAIDTFSTEPPIGSPLLELETTVVTPHCTDATIDYFAILAVRGVENACRTLAGQDIPASDFVTPVRRTAIA